MRSTPLTLEELRQLFHDLREPMGAFVIYLALLDDEELTAHSRERIGSMLANVERMMKAVGDITRALRLENGDSTPLAILTRHRAMHRVEPFEADPDFAEAKTAS